MGMTRTFTYNTDDPIEITVLNAIKYGSAITLKYEEKIDTIQGPFKNDDGKSVLLIKTNYLDIID